MTIRIYPSLLPGQAIETHEHGRTTLGAWLDAKGIDWRDRCEQPILAMRDGHVIPVDEWGTTEIGPEDEVSLRLIPHGGIFKALGGIIGKIFNLAFSWLMPSARTAGRSDTPQGRDLGTASATANSAKLGQVVPELFGTHRRFPDYLTPPRRYFSNLREQWLVFHACVGPGQYQIDASNVRVGDTPFSALGDDAIYQIFQPAADLSGVETHEHWHTVDEVGGTSSGTPGLELSTEIANRTNSQPTSYAFEADQISRSEGQFPEGWGNGTTVNVEYPRTYAVVTRVNAEPAYSISQITGYFGHLANVSVGQNITVGVLGNEVTYRISASMLVSSGVYMLELRTSEDAPVLLPSGTQTLIFGASRARTIITYGPTALTLSSGGFQAGTETNVRVVFSGGTVYGEWTSEFVASPGTEWTSLIEVDIFFPNGLAYINDNGSLATQTVGAEIQYRDVSGGPRVTVSRTYTQSTPDQIGVTERIAISPMRPAVRMRRVGAEGTSTQVQDKCTWYGLKSRLSTATSYPNWTTMSVRLRSGGKLSAQSENQINVIATRILPTLQSDGDWSAPVATRDISAAAKYILSTIGYTDADINMAELRRLHAVWSSRGEPLDYIYDETTVRQALGIAFGAGMADMSVEDGLVTPVRDDVRTTFESGQGYSPQNMTGSLRRTFSAPSHDDPDGVEVEYIDAQTWTSSVVQCRLPDDQGIKVEKVKIDGVTDRTRAWRIGMRRRRALKYRRWNYEFATELAALNSRYLSYVPLFDDTPGYGQSMVLRGVESHTGGALLHVTEPLIWHEGQSHVVAYRRPDGTVAGPYPATPGPDEYSVIADLPQPWPLVTLKREPPHVYFGTLTRWCYPALVEEIRPDGNDRVSVTATNYDTRVYADDNNTPA